LVRALYNQLFAQEPVGLAFRDWHVGVGTLYATWAQLLDDFNRGNEVARTLLYTRLAAQDLQTTVILGDPVAAFTNRIFEAINGMLLDVLAAGHHGDWHCLRAV
jgi:hypothetical protein